MCVLFVCVIVIFRGKCDHLIGEAGGSWLALLSFLTCILVCLTTSWCNGVISRPCL